MPLCFVAFFFLNDTATTEIYTLSLHDALPIWTGIAAKEIGRVFERFYRGSGSLEQEGFGLGLDRKSTRLNSSHVEISYAVFCLKKKKKKRQDIQLRRKNATIRDSTSTL